MTISMATTQARKQPVRAWAQAALGRAATGWFAVAFAGQLVFAAYIMVSYGGPALHGDFAAWNRVMRHGYQAGAAMGNTATAVHLLAAALLTVGGVLQLLPRLRARWPVAHRWIGRTYLLAAVGASLTGIWMVWWRDAAGDTVQHAGTTLNAFIVLLCAALALDRIRRRDIDAHRRWALRLFFAASGVWFFRIGLMFWIALNGGPAGFDPVTFTGPVLSFIAFGQYLVPLAVLELYLWCRARGGMAAFGMAAVLGAATLATAVGIGVATAGMWWPAM